MGLFTQNDAYIFWGVSHPFYYTVLSFRAFVCFAVSFVVVCSCFLFVSRFRLWLFCGCSDSILFDFFFFVILFGGCCFVCTFAYKKGLGGPVTRRLETVQASAGYQDLSFIIPKTKGFGFSKRWVSFHKTTRIFDGFEQGLFNGCSMIVQWLFNGWRMVVTMRCVLRFLLRA